MWWRCVSAFLLASFISYSSIVCVGAAYAETFHIPLRFEPNLGQANSEVRFIARSAGTTFLFDERGVSIIFKSTGISPLRMNFVGASSNTHIRGADLTPAQSHYFKGQNSSDWITKVPQYGRLFYDDLYPGIDVIFYASPEGLEYDYIVHPGSNPQNIRLAFEGETAQRLSHKALVVENLTGELTLQAPHIYQETDEEIKPVHGEYVVTANHEIALTLSDFDKSLPLIVDPILSFSTYLGGGSFDEAHATALAPDGSVYICGSTISSDFPVTSGSLLGFSDGFVSKFNADGSLAYSIFLGGTGDDDAYDLTVDQRGDLYVTGFTNSSDFPAIYPLLNQFSAFAPDAFITKINADGSTLLYSTRLGGSSGDEGLGIAVDQNGDVYVTGDTASVDFPLRNPMQNYLAGNIDAFVSKLHFDVSAATLSLEYSTYLGGTLFDVGADIAVDNAGSSYITGDSDSTDLPLANPIQSARARRSDAFVAKFVPSGRYLEYSSYLGGNGWDYGRGIAIDSGGSAYVTGTTASTDFPTMHPLQAASGGMDDIFVTKLTPDGSALLYSTYLGGSDRDVGNEIAIDASGTPYIVGHSVSIDFPLVNPFQGTRNGPSDVIMSRLKADGSALIYSSYLGGSRDETGEGMAVDTQGSIIITGSTYSRNFPLLNPTQSTSHGFDDAFVTKIIPEAFVEGITLWRSTVVPDHALRFEAHLINNRAATDQIQVWSDVFNMAGESFPQNPIGGVQNIQVPNGPNALPFNIRLPAAMPLGGPYTIRFSTGNYPNATSSAEAQFFVISRLDRCLLGNVEGALGNPQAVLLVNAISSHATIGQGQPISIVMTTPPSRANAPFVLYAWRGRPSEATIQTLPRGIGESCMATPLTGGAPQAIWNNIGRRRVFGAPTYPSRQAPSIVMSLPHGINHRATFTLQGFILDPNAPNGQLAVTNAVVVEVR